MPRQRLQASAEDLVEAIDRAVAGLTQARDRAQRLNAELTTDRPLREIVEDEPRPLVVELLTEVQDLLSRGGSAFRRAEARALHEEGISMEAIARLFGVTRQRVSALLRVRPPASGTG